MQLVVLLMGWVEEGVGVVLDVSDQKDYRKPIGIVE